MPKFKGINKQLKPYVDKQIQEALYKKRDVFVNVAKEKVQSEVYDEYQPTMYQRTGKLKESFETTPINNGIVIDNTRSENGRDIAEIIEKGHYNSDGYNYVKKGASYLLPREFMKEAKQEIKDRKLHITELQKGLKEKGINTKR